MAQSTITASEAMAKLVRTPKALPAWRHVSQYLVTDANGDSNDMAVDGSGGSPVVFSYTPPANYDFIASRINIYLQTSSAMSVAVFGNLAAALGQGVEIKAAGVLLTTFKDNIDMYTEYYDNMSAANVSDAGADTTLVGRWTFWKDTNSMGILVPNGSSFEAIINDDLSTITTFRMKMKGMLRAINLSGL